MPLSASTTRSLLALDIEPTADEPLHRRSYWRVGGPADGWLRVHDLHTLRAVVRVCADTSCPVFVLGNGSNLLVSDRGVRGMVVQLSGELAQIEADDCVPPTLTVGAGAKLVVLLNRAGKRGWAGVGCFAGIPGTLGGAVRMNAGARLGETRDCLINVDLVLPDGSMVTRTQAELRMSYRTANLPAGSIIARARLRTTTGDANAEREAIRRHLDHRASTQPLHLPSCGSTFTNPPGDHAGRLIEASGLKGYTVGAAQVSHKHANFIVNLGGATADQIRSVIEHVQRTVLDRFDVALEREVHFAGDWSHWP